LLGCVPLISHIAHRGEDNDAGNNGHRLDRWTQWKEDGGLHR
jgi:hypothetical protein